MMVYSEFETPAARKIAQFIRKRVKEGVTEDKQKAIREVLAKFKEKVGVEQLAQDLKLYHGIKK